MARVLAALSGGVDSAVAAALLVREGHEVIGVSLQLADHGTGGSVSRCCSASDLLDARRVCGALGIPYYVLDEEEAFSREVLDPFVEAFRSGRTPNPCVRCNSVLKFGSLLRIAKSLGAARIATGHYARLERHPGGAARLLRGKDPAKDQSYYLFDLDGEQRDAALFPVGGMSKEEVYESAARLGLPVAGKPESQDLCFVGAGGAAAWLDRRIGAAPPGEIVDGEGRALGRHDGLHHFTVGQRRGLGVASRTPLYVLRMEAAANRVVVGPEESLAAAGLTAAGCRLHEAGLEAAPFRAIAKIRSRHAGAPATVRSLGPGRLEVLFDEPQRAVAPGQAVVLYRGDLVLGGGWIEGPLVLDPPGPSPVEYGGYAAGRA